MCFLWRNVYSSPLPIFSVGLFVFCTWYHFLCGPCVGCRFARASCLRETEIRKNPGLRSGLAELSFRIQGLLGEPSVCVSPQAKGPVCVRTFPMHQCSLSSCRSQGRTAPYGYGCSPNAPQSVLHARVLHQSRLSARLHSLLFPV